jgi:hypothetical protein
MAPIVCVNCKCSMKKTLIGVLVGFIVKSVDPERPYEIWSGDVWTCPQCDSEVVGQYGNNAIWRHFHKDDPPKLDLTITSER